MYGYLYTVKCKGYLALFYNFFKLFFFQGGLAVQHTFSMTLTNNNWMHKFEFILNFL